MYNRLTPTEKKRTVQQHKFDQFRNNNDDGKRTDVLPLSRRPVSPTNQSPEVAVGLSSETLNTQWVPSCEAVRQLGGASPLPLHGGEAAAPTSPVRMRSRESAKKRPKVKGIPMNTCLNFRYQNRSSHEQQKQRTRRLIFDKGAFLQANFKFTVSDAVDVDRFLSDPDRLFDWHDVLELEMSVTEEIMCPISLDVPPICPHITPCGHVFSFPAIIRHLMTVGNASLSKEVPCPLCYAPFNASALRSVRLRRQQARRMKGALMDDAS